MPPDRLDILLYAHDGRGLGHVSRTVAIGLALRRLFPELRVCLVTGCPHTQDLIGPGRLDWIKLPAYDTTVIDGVSHGIEGPSGFSDGDLARLRSGLLASIFDQLQPRLLLADHTPQGKHKELVFALSDNAGRKPPVCLLGIRGIVGDVAQAASNVALELFHRHYSACLWFGDSSVLGKAHQQELSARFKRPVQECGYVSRLREQRYLDAWANEPERHYACTVSIPWFTSDTRAFAAALIEAVRRLTRVYGRFRFFLGRNAPRSLWQELRADPQCPVEPFGSSYGASLRASRTAVIFGGYNSLVDVLGAAVPALVVLRSMQDREQQEHLKALTRAGVSGLTVITENESTPETLYSLLAANLERVCGKTAEYQIDCNGAETAARLLKSHLEP